MMAKVRTLEEVEQRLRNTLPGVKLEWQRGELPDDTCFLRCTLDEHTATIQKSFRSRFGVTCTQAVRVDDVPHERFLDGQDAVNRVVSLLVFGEFTDDS